MLLARSHKNKAYKKVFTKMGSQPKNFTNQKEHQRFAASIYRSLPAPKRDIIAKSIQMSSNRGLNINISIKDTGLGIT